MRISSIKCRPDCSRDNSGLRQAIFEKKNKICQVLNPRIRDFSDGDHPRARFFHQALSGDLEVPGRGGGKIDPDRGADLMGEEEAGLLQPLGGAFLVLKKD